ncbi:two-component regulator propeller domain-containing protein [Luteimonas vadosa]|uniref:diguanylate cyclase n=1 Tax=Luteimonas vadosa TaxID=1165507 RepID=A0ABP9E0E7_9GAMM
MAEKGREQTPTVLTWLAASAVALVSLCAQPVLALDPEKAFHHYVRDSWSIERGLPQITANAITQDRLGYLWVATQAGVARFDGVRFTTYNLQNTPELPGQFINTLLSDRGDRLWVGTYKGLAVREDDRWRRVPALDARHEPLDIRALARDAQGPVLVGTPDGVFRVQGEGLRFVRPLPGPAESLLPEGDLLWAGTLGGVYRIRGDQVFLEPLPREAGSATVGQLLRAQGRLWAGSNQGLFYRTQQGWRRFEGQRVLAEEPILALYEDGDDNLWVGAIGGLGRLRDRALHEFVADGSPGAFNSVRAIFEDRENNLWLGSQWDGIARLWNGWTRRYSTIEGLNEPVVWSLARGPRGRVWVGTQDGLSLFDQGRYTLLASGQSLPHPNAYSLLPEEDLVWIGTRRGLAQYRDGRIHVPDGFEALSGAQVNGFLRDRKDRLWIATTQGVYRQDDGRLVHLGTQAGLADPRVRALHETRDGRMLVGTQVGLYEFVDERLRLVGDRLGLPPDLDVTAIHELSTGGLLVGALSEDMYFFDRGRWVHLGAEQGMPVNSPFFITEDGRGYVWAAGIRGVHRVPLRDLQAFSRGMLDRVRGQMLHNERGDRRSGQRGFCCNGAGLSKGFIQDGELWLPSRNGIVVMDTGGIVRNAVPPTVVVEGLRSSAGWHPAATIAGGALPPDQRDLAFDFTALSFQDPGSIGLRYRLRGYDSDWRELADVSQRSANYTNLPPGNYVFEAQGSNNADVWQTGTARLAFAIQPRFHETTLFLVLIGLVAASLIYAGYRIQQLRHLRGQQALEEVVQRRTADLGIANQRLEEASQTDPLTALRNRRYLSAQVPADLAFYKREMGQLGPGGQVLRFAMVDIDHFQAICDTWGHAVGDQVLQQVARVLSRLVRSSDYLVRWGGEEFLLVFRPMPGRHLELIAERIRDAIASHVFVVDESEPLRLTCSIGLADYPVFTDHRLPLGWEATVELADLALSFVKRHGRDGWAAFQPTATTDPATLLQDLRSDPMGMIGSGRIRIVSSVQHGD